MHLTLVPAYGRDYKSKGEVLVDLMADKDFDLAGITGSGKINLAELRQDAVVKGPQQVNIRYKRLQNVMVLTVHHDHLAVVGGSKVYFTAAQEVKP